MSQQIWKVYDLADFNNSLNLLDGEAILQVFWIEPHGSVTITSDRVLITHLFSLLFSQLKK